MQYDQTLSDGAMKTKYNLYFLSKNRAMVNIIQIYEY